MSEWLEACIACPSIRIFTRIVIVETPSQNCRHGNDVNSAPKQWKLAEGRLPLLVGTKNIKDISEVNISHIHLHTSTLPWSCPTAPLCLLSSLSSASLTDFTEDRRWRRGKLCKAGNWLCLCLSMTSTSWRSCSSSASFSFSTVRLRSRIDCTRCCSSWMACCKIGLQEIFHVYTQNEKCKVLFGVGCRRW